MRCLKNAIARDAEVQNDWILRAGLLAASSSAKFFKTVFGNSDRNDTPAENDLEDTQEDANEAHQQQITGTATAYHMPSRAQTDKLLNRFWTHVYIQWFDRAEFQSWYESIWTSELHMNSNEKINFAILNLILALVYRTEPDFEDDRDNMAKTHFDQAQELLQINVLGFDRINLLYALFLMLQWYQSVNDVKQCLSLIRLCLLLAQNIGIDDAERVAAFKSQRQREMARRAWHGCILMDRIIAMVSGRPPQISQSVAQTIPLFTSIDDQFLTTNGEDGRQPKNVFSGQEFFLQFCRLHLILGNILLDDHGDAINLNRIVELDRALHEFDKNLPLELQYNIVNDQFLGQAVHLRTRLLYIKILLCRPFFTHATESMKIYSNSSTFGDIVIHGGLLKCVDAAIELLDLLDSGHSVVDRRPGTIPQWWHTIGYVYSASTVIIAAHLFPSILSAKQIELEQAIRQGFHVLDCYKRFRQPAQLCRKALDSLYTRYVANETMSEPIPGTQATEAIELPWAWESVLDLFDDNGMFDFGQFD